MQLLRSALLQQPFIQLDWENYCTSVSTIHQLLEQLEGALTGWLNLPFQQNEATLQPVQQLADEIKQNAEVLVVVGIGGSYLGANAVQRALTPYFGTHDNGIEVIYAGHHMSGTYMRQLLESLQDKEVYVNVVSKSGTTIESALAFRIIRHYMENRYGTNASERIIVTTDAKKGRLLQMAKQNGYRQLDIPSNIGGRFSVFTAAGLLPITVAGIELQQLVAGARQAALDLKEERLAKNEAYQYAVIRHALYRKGYKIELLASFEQALAPLLEWWKQLFGESEGKEQQGLFPVAVNYSTDLHAIGQFVQDGSPILFETIIHFNEMKDDFFISYDRNDLDQLNYVACHSFNEMNTIAKDSVALAHSEGGIPIIQLELARLDAYHIGYLLYFFMKACAMSAFLLQVNPFNQPAVEVYKETMQRKLQREKLIH